MASSHPPVSQQYPSDQHPLGLDEHDLRHQLENSPPVRNPPTLNLSDVPASAQTPLTSHQDTTRSWSRVLPILVRHSSKPSLQFRCLCIIDPQRHSSFIGTTMIPILSLPLTPHSYSVTSIVGTHHSHNGALVRGLEAARVGTEDWFKLPDMLTSPAIPETRHEMATRDVVQSYPHIAYLAEFFPEEVDSGKTLLILGRNSPITSAAKIFGDYSPQVYLGHLGWSLVGCDVNLSYPPSLTPIPKNWKIKTTHRAGAKARRQRKHREQHALACVEAQQLQTDSSTVSNHLSGIIPTPSSDNSALSVSLRSPDSTSGLTSWEHNSAPSVFSGNPDPAINATPQHAPSRDGFATTMSHQFADFDSFHSPTTTSPLHAPPSDHIASTSSHQSEVLNSFHLPSATPSPPATSNDSQIRHVTVVIMGSSHVTALKDLRRTTSIHYDYHSVHYHFADISGATFRTYTDDPTKFDEVTDRKPDIIVTLLGGNSITKQIPQKQTRADCFKFFTRLRHHVGDHVHVLACEVFMRHLNDNWRTPSPDIYRDRRDDVNGAISYMLGAPNVIPLAGDLQLNRSNATSDGTHLYPSGYQQILDHIDRAVVGVLLRWWDQEYNQQ